MLDSPKRPTSLRGVDTQKPFDECEPLYFWNAFRHQFSSTLPLPAKSVCLRGSTLLYDLQRLQLLKIQTFSSIYCFSMMPKMGSSRFFTLGGGGFDTGFGLAWFGILISTGMGRKWPTNLQRESNLSHTVSFVDVNSLGRNIHVAVNKYSCRLETPCISEVDTHFF